MALVKVGCKLPHGVIAELGYSFQQGTYNLVKSTKYARIKINGTNSNLVKGALASANQAPGITEMEESFITEWLDKNKALGFVKAGMIYIIKNDAEGKAIELDQSKMKTGFEPLNRKDMPVDSEGKPLIEMMTKD